MQVTNARLMALMSATLLLSTATVSSWAQELTTLNILVTNERATSAYPVFVGRELGFYEDEGLEVNFLPTDTTVPYIAFLSNGSADMVMMDPPSILQGIESGQPVVAIYEYMQRTPETLVVPQSSDVWSLADLAGKTIGMAADRDQITIDVSLQTAGLDPNQVSKVVIGDSVPLIVNQINSGNIDGYAGGANETAGLEAAGIALRHLTPPAISTQPGNFIVIWAPRTDELRDPVTRFLRAYNKAATAAMLDIDAVAAMSRKNVPEQWENLEMGWSILEQAAYGLLLQRTRVRGELQPDLWDNINQIYLDLGEISRTHDPVNFMDPSFAEAAYDFETADVKAALIEWREANQEHLLPE